MKRRFLISGLLMAAVMFTAAAADPQYISPNNDGVQDELVIPLKVSDKRYVQGWSLVITDANGNVVRTIGNKISLPERLSFKAFFKQLITPKQGVKIPESVTWNGAMNNGETAPDGNYKYYLTATDDNGNTGKTKDYEVVIDTVAPDVELSQPGDKIFGEGAKAALKIRQTGSVEDEWVGVFKSADGTVVRTVKWVNAEPAEFSWKGNNDQDEQIADGVYSYEIAATDRAGNVSIPASITNIIYSAEKPATNIFIAGSRYFSPGTDSNSKEVTLDVSIPVPDAKSGNKLVEWAVTVKDSAGKAVRVYNQDNYGALPPAKVVFDGKDDSGKALKDGEYQAVLSAKYLNGYVPAELSSPVLVLDTEKPSAQIVASEKVFGAGSKDSVKFSIMITPSEGAAVPSWVGEIQNEEGKAVASYDFGEYPPQEVVWNGISSNGTIAEKGKYRFVLSGTDLAGNTGVSKTTEYVTFDTTETQLLLAVSDTAFSPNGNKVKDTLTFTPVTATKDVASYEFVITDDKGKEVYSVKENKKLPVNFVWDGKDSSKILCADGFYSSKLSVVAANGSTASAVSQKFELDTVTPKLSAEIPWNAFSPYGNGAQKNIPVTIKESTAEKLWVAEVRDSKDKPVKKFSWNGSKDKLIWNGDDESGNMAADGKYNIVLFSTDDAGNSFSTELKGITLDNRETKAYVTAEYEGISPNGDGNLETQKFEINISVKDSIVSWNFDVRKEDGTSVFGLSEKDSANLPASINWNGAGADGLACEGTFTGTLDVVYNNGNKVSAVSSPFICTATAPALVVKTAPEYFSPDNDGVDDDLYIKLSGSTKARIKNWSFVIKDPKGKDFWKTSGKTQITERIIWDGLSNVQKDTNGNAERVQSAMDYPYEFTVTDNLGMTSKVSGVIPIDVLVIRDGNLLKMAVPSIIFESDAANFQTANAKLDADKVNNNVKVLNRIADILKKFKDYKVTVVGHANKITDNPDEETVDNPREWGRASMPLSKERADAIKTYLTKKGVSAASLSTDGKGGTQPVANPKDKDNNWKNRRVEFILQK